MIEIPLYFVFEGWVLGLRETLFVIGLQVKAFWHFCIGVLSQDFSPIFTYLHQKMILVVDVTSTTPKQVVLSCPAHRSAWVSGLDCTAEDSRLGYTMYV